MITLLLLINLSVTATRDLRDLIIRYGEGSKVEVCVEAEGQVDDRYNPGEYILWWSTSCWRPFYKTENHKLWPKTTKVKVIVKSVEGVEEVLIVNVRPVEGEDPFMGR